MRGFGPAAGNRAGDGGIVHRDGPGEDPCVRVARGADGAHDTQRTAEQQIAAVDGAETSRTVPDIAQRPAVGRYGQIVRDRRHNSRSRIAGGM